MYSHHPHDGSVSSLGVKQTSDKARSKSHWREFYERELGMLLHVSSTWKSSAGEGEATSVVTKADTSGAEDISKCETSWGTCEALSPRENCTSQTGFCVICQGGDLYDCDAREICSTCISQNSTEIGNIASARSDLAYERCKSHQSDDDLDYTKQKHSALSEGCIKYPQRRRVPTITFGDEHVTRPSIVQWWNSAPSDDSKLPEIGKSSTVMVSTRSMESHTSVLKYGNNMKALSPCSGLVKSRLSLDSADKQVIPLQAKGTESKTLTFPMSSKAWPVKHAASSLKRTAGSSDMDFVGPYSTNDMFRRRGMRKILTSLSRSTRNRFIETHNHKRSAVSNRNQKSSKADIPRDSPVAVNAYHISDSEINTGSPKDGTADKNSDSVKVTDHSSEVVLEKLPVNVQTSEENKPNPKKTAGQSSTVASQKSYRKPKSETNTGHSVTLKYTSSNSKHANLPQNTSHELMEALASLRQKKNDLELKASHKKVTCSCHDSTAIKLGENNTESSVTNLPAERNASSSVKAVRWVGTSGPVDSGYRSDMTSYLKDCHNHQKLEMETGHRVIKKMVNKEVSASDIVNAENFFGTLAHITTSQLPQSRLLALLGEKKKHLLNGEDRNKKSGEPKLTDRTTESVGRAGLTYIPPDVFNQKLQEQQPRRNFVKSYVKDLTKSAIHADQKHVKLQQMWPQIFAELIRNAVMDMWDTQAYMKKCMDDLDKS